MHKQSIISLTDMHLCIKQKLRHVQRKKRRKMILKPIAVVQSKTQQPHAMVIYETVYQFTCLVVMETCYHTGY